MYDSDPDFRMYVTLRANQLRNRNNAHQPVVVQVLPAMILGPFLIPWLASDTYRRSITNFWKCRSNDTDFDDELDVVANVSPVPEGRDMFWMFRKNDDNIENNRQNINDPNKDYIPPPKNKILEGIPVARKIKNKNLSQGGGGYRDRWELPDGTKLEWDYRHGTVEKWNKQMTKN